MKFHGLRPFLVGLGMGAADVIPGVSGGTIAFITGVYDELLTSLTHIDNMLYRFIISAQRRQARSYINGTFLVKIFGGIIIAILLLAKMMTFLLDVYPSYIFAFFFGLILASIVYIKNQVGKKTRQTFIAFIGGIVIGYLATADTAFMVSEQPKLISIFFAGALASMAMILPGISGSYILILLGKYAYILETLSDRIDHVSESVRHGDILGIISPELGVISIFVGGIIIGLLLFSRVLHWLLRKHRDITLAMLIGCMIGALHIIWPRSTTTTTLQSLLLVLFIFIGIGVIYGITALTRTKKTTS